jgi:hypothetical protein
VKEKNHFDMNYHLEKQREKLAKLELRILTVYIDFGIHRYSAIRMLCFAVLSSG